MRCLSMLCLLAATTMLAKSLFYPTAEVTIRRDDRNLILVHDKRDFVHLHTEPRGSEHLVEFRLEDNCMVMDLRKLASLPKMPKVVIGWDNVGQLEFPEQAYRIAIDISTEAPQTAFGIYFEGGTLDGIHYYKLFPKTAVQQRRTCEAIYDLPAKMQNFHCRFDFTSPNVFRIYDVRFDAIPLFVKPETPRKAELLFHAPFDGSPEASFAQGSPVPLLAQNLSYERGLNGQALYASKAAKSVLSYATKDNFQRNAGAISVWVCPKWDTGKQNTYNPEDFRCFVSMAHPKPRHGSGAIWLWSYGNNLRWDTSDINDSYSTAPSSFQKNRWYHLVMNWDENGSVTYINGQKALRNPGGDGYSPLKLAASGHNYHMVRKDIDIDTFFVGCNLVSDFAQQQQAESLIDDLRIYSAPLSPAEIQALNSEFSFYQAQILTPYLLAPDQRHRLGDTLKMRITSPLAKALSFNLELQDANGKTLDTFKKPLVKPAGETTVLFENTLNCPPGDYLFQLTETTQSNGILTTKLPFHVLTRENPCEAPKGEQLQLRHITTIIPSTNMPSDDFAHVGDVHLGTLNNRTYLETDNSQGSRFALRAKLPDAKGIYLLEMDYPDDKPRSCDIVVQSSRPSSGEYELQNGYCSGAEYPCTHTFITHRCIYFARSQDITAIFMGARDNKPAALAELRIYQVLNGLPPADITEPALDSDDDTRHLGIYFEDPAINFDFGVNGSSEKDFPIMLNRIAAYMHYSGQDILTYPMVWYHGRIGDFYNPRNHVSGFMEAILKRFDDEKLGFIPSFNWHNLYFDDLTVTQDAIDKGLFHDSPIAIWDDGKPNPGRWHGSPPNYNILHPRVQQAILDEVDYFLGLGKSHKSFKGINLHLTVHCLCSFGNLNCGYNDYAIDAFTKHTGIAVPVDRTNPMRGKDYAEWLRANAWSQWIDFRCRSLADVYLRIAKRLSDSRPDLKLVVTTFNGMTFLEDSTFTAPEHTYNAVRAGGIDARYLSEAPNLILAQGDYPADFRWRENHNLPRNKANYEFLVQYDSQPGFFTMLKQAKQPWLHMHDRYWESAVGARGGSHWSGNCRPFQNTPWLNETGWRVSTLNPAGHHAMKQYVLPLRYVDLLSITKGGFLIGTYGMEDYLVPFAKAFRALPARTFTDIPYNSPTLKARQLHYRGMTYFYLVNTADSQDSAILDFPDGVAVDLISQQQTNSGTRISLKPYELRSFVLRGTHTITVKP